MSKLLLFTDGSVNVQTKIGYGACLIIPESDLNLDNIHQKIQVKRFEETSSSKLELQTLLWALNKIEQEKNEIVVYTDSQTIVGLPKRRNRLEKNNFTSKKGILLKNSEHYKELFNITDKLNIEIIKVRGHQPTKNKNEVERIFALVDKASRKVLRREHL